MSHLWSPTTNWRLGKQTILSGSPAQHHPQIEYKRKRKKTKDGIWSGRANQLSLLEETSHHTSYISLFYIHAQRQTDKICFPYNESKVRTCQPPFTITTTLWSTHTVKQNDEICFCDDEWINTVPAFCLFHICCRCSFCCLRKHPSCSGMDGQPSRQADGSCGSLFDPVSVGHPQTLSGWHSSMVGSIVPLMPGCDILAEAKQPTSFGLEQMIQRPSDGSQQTAWVGCEWRWWSQ